MQLQDIKILSTQTRHMLLGQSGPQHEDTTIVWNVDSPSHKDTVSEPENFTLKSIIVSDSLLEVLWFVLETSVCDFFVYGQTAPVISKLHPPYCLAFWDVFQRVPPVTPSNRCLWQICNTKYRC